MSCIQVPVSIRIPGCPVYENYLIAKFSLPSNSFLIAFIDKFPSYAHESRYLCLLLSRKKLKNYVYRYSFVVDEKNTTKRPISQPKINRR
jgi:hypothetical protein